ncbi:hypothetical protein PsorP6_008355 [Peronosclerospora sorghi]|uniref:Uncharacterized protein n=1 Tax=Peronosclerospora sorghi TaxID=230839 RepID=A0ACC0W7V8_9STRA|nr:hypothetical protein PsorP6_008355 [Peronosclerospora sorghi]
MATKEVKPGYPQIPRAREIPMNVHNDTARDTEMARQLQNQYDQGQVMAVAQPVQQNEIPYKCGNCGTTHVVRNVTHGSTFYCTVCNAQNQIILEHRRPMVVVYVEFAVNNTMKDIAYLTCSALWNFVAVITRTASCRSHSSAT